MDIEVETFDIDDEKNMFYGCKGVTAFKPKLKKFRKKPIEIEAYQTEEEIIINTLEGDMRANVGDWIITGVNGEQYPCKPDIFEKTYEEV